MKRDLRAGYFLLEILVYIVILAVILNVATQVLLTCTRLSTFGARTADAVVQRQALEDAFRGAAREAFAVSPGIGAYRTGADALVLETPGAEGRRFVVVGRLGEAEKVGVLRCIERNGAFETESMKTFPLEGSTLQFVYDTPEPTSARLVTMKTAAKGRDATDVSAALRGIARQ